MRWLTKPEVPASASAATSVTPRRPRSTDFNNIMEPVKGIPPTAMPMPRFMVTLVANWRKEGVFDPPAPTD